MVLAHVILGSAHNVQILLFFFLGGLLFDLGVCWDRGLDLDFDQGLTILIYDCTSAPKVQKLVLPLWIQYRCKE